MLKDKVVLITGASYGLGESVAYKVAKEGAKVALLARSQAKLVEMEEKIKQTGGLAESFVCDVRDMQNVKDTVAKVIKVFGTIDTLVNNAGVWTSDELEEKDPSKIKNAFETNTLSHIYFINAVLPILKAKNSGQIINVISDSGLPFSDDSTDKTYAATKWAMTGFTKNLLTSLAGTKIKVMAFHPGAFKTDIFKRAGENYVYDWPEMNLEDVSDVLLFMLTRPDNLTIPSICIEPVFK